MLRLSLLLLLTMPADGPPPLPCDNPPALRVLMIGNSYTSYNELPRLLRELGTATHGCAVDVEPAARDGARFVDHLASPHVRDRIREGRFDVVILQGQSLETLADPGPFFQAGRELASLARGAGSQVIWFATWARGAESPQYRLPFLRMGPDRMARAVEGRYVRIAAGNDRIARVGAAWDLALGRFPDVPLHVPDASHPNGAGSLLTACVLYATLMGETPRAPEPAPYGLSSELANRLCALSVEVNPR
ncbi:MAG: hypothetical protein AAGE52_10085 [Myxococcota bacterium]